MKDTSYIIIFCCVGLWLCAGNVSAQTVSNVTAEQVGKTIHIHYDLDRAADISVFVSTDGGSTYKQLHRVSGDVGETVGPGHKVVVWDVHAEMCELQGDNIVFKVRVSGNAEARWRKQLRAETKKEEQEKKMKEGMTAKEAKVKKVTPSIPYSTFFTLNVAYSPLPQWSYGFKVGGVKRVGWFASVMTNFNFAGWGNPFNYGYEYYLAGDSKTIRLSAQAGFVYRPFKPLTLLLGLGYGYRTLTYRTNVYQGGNYLYSLWRSYPERTYQGVDVSFGLLFDIKGSTFSAEAVTTNFQTIEAKIGVGFCLPHKKSKKQNVKVLK
ncbi:MAG: hypothetical protein IKQ20_05880 [Bacteroidales bacterium]|nr:hypothetical protein [Bacteroidales bacterium]